MNDSPKKEIKTFKIFSETDLLRKRLFAENSKLIEGMIQKFDTDDKCWGHLFRLKSKGYSCLRCGHQEHYFYNERSVFQCKNKTCKHQATVREGTIYAKSSVNLHIWFKMVIILVSTYKPVSIRSLEEGLGIEYDTARRMKNKIEKALFEPDAIKKLGGIFGISKIWTARAYIRFKEAEFGRNMSHRKDGKKFKTFIKDCRADLENLSGVSTEYTKRNKKINDIKKKFEEILVRGNLISEKK